jgi:hypothetical protein
MRVALKTQRFVRARLSMAIFIVKNVLALSARNFNQLYGACF